MRGWQHVETWLHLLYSFWMSTLVSMTAAGDEIGARNRIISMLRPANSGWTGYTAVGITQLDCLVSAVSCKYVLSVALLSSCRFIASS